MGKAHIAIHASGSLTAEQLLLARKLFKLRIHEAKGMEYQRLFEALMAYRYPGDFIPIKPYGQGGDRKNDGYCKSQGLYHQVYAPEQPTKKVTVVSAAKKAVVDFAGLRKNWNHVTPIRGYRFVFNDEYNGCPPDVAIACAALAKAHSIDASPFLAMHLEDEAMKLSTDQLMQVINSPIPSGDIMPSIDFSMLREVILHVLNNSIPLTRQGLLKVPDFTKKIEFNGLSKPVGHLLHAAARQSEAVTDYFSRNSTNGKQALRNKLSAMYNQSALRLKKRKAAQDHADLVFFDLLSKMVPTDLTNGGNHERAQTAALVVMSFYFEACDVFEHPHATP